MTNKFLMAVLLAGFCASSAIVCVTPVAPAAPKAAKFLSVDTAKKVVDTFTKYTGLSWTCGKVKAHPYLTASAALVATLAVVYHYNQDKINELLGLDDKVE